MIEEKLKEKLKEVFLLLSHIERYTELSWSKYTWMSEIAAKEIQKDLESIRGKLRELPDS